MNKFWTPAACIHGIFLLAALSACSGSGSEQTQGDLDAYCASVDYADEVCDELELSGEPAEDQTGAHPCPQSTAQCWSGK